MNKNHDGFGGFTVNLFLDEDGDYLAHFVEMPNVSAFSDTPEGALRELAIAWQCVKETYVKITNPSHKHRRGKDTRDRSTSLLMHNFITHCK